jgi:hypothetical protein
MTPAPDVVPLFDVILELDELASWVLQRETRT